MLLVKIHRNGKIEMKVCDEPGPACKKIMAQAIAALGESLVVHEDRATAEFYEQETTATRQEVHS